MPEMGKCRYWRRVSDNDTVNRTWQSTESLLGHELKPDTAIRTTKGFVFASFRFCVVGRVNFWWSHAGIEIPYIALFPLPISHPNPIKTRNPTPTNNWNSRFPPLFSAQIPNIAARKGQIPRPAKPIGDPLQSNMQIAAGLETDQNHDFDFKEIGHTQLNSSTLLVST